MANHFKIHCICLVKNEADIIEYSLKKACQWADFIYVYDNGSTDGTWEKVIKIQNQQIIPWKSNNKPFQESIRGEVFNHFRENSQNGDWWCRLDADEIYINSPRQFLAEIKPEYHVVWGIAIEYYLTHTNIKELNFNQNISELIPKIRFYKAENSEIRFFRYRNRLSWHEKAQWPTHIGLVHPKRILYKHYKYRSPLQIQKRLDTRCMARKQGFPGWEHASVNNWQKQIAKEEELNHDNQDGNYHLDLDNLPDHKEFWIKHYFKQVMHRTRVWP